MAEKKSINAVITAVRDLGIQGSSYSDIQKYLSSEPGMSGLDTKTTKLHLKNAVDKGFLSNMGGTYKVNETARRRRSRSKSRGKSKGRRKSKKRSGSRRRRRSSGSKKRKSSGGRKRRRRSKKHAGHDEED